MTALDRFALHLNNFRIIPRLVVLWLLHTTWSAHVWFQRLQRVPTDADVAYVALFTGLFVVAFKFYVETGSFQRTDGQQNG